MEADNKSFSKTFAGTVKCILGTAQSIGITVNKQHPKKVIESINKGEIKLWWERGFLQTYFFYLCVYVYILCCPPCTAKRNRDKNNCNGI